MSSNRTTLMRKRDRMRKDSWNYHNLMKTPTELADEELGCAYGNERPRR